MSLLKAARWVSCAKDVEESTARTRHLLWSDQITTFCGATGVGAGVWRGNSTKPRCQVCLNAKGRQSND